MTHGTNRANWAHAPVIGWFLIIEKDNTKATWNQSSMYQLRVNEDRVFFGTHVYGDFGDADNTDVVRAMFTSLNIKGDLLWEKAVGIGANLTDWFYFNKVDWMYENPNDANNITFGGLIQNGAKTRDEFVIGNIDADGAFTHLVDSGATNDLGADDSLGFDGIGVCSNGDVWVHSVGNNEQGRVVLLDASDDYESSLVETSIDAFGTYDWITNWSADYNENITTMMGDDSFVIFGCKGGDGGVGTGELCVAKITTGGTVTSIEAYVDSSQEYVQPYSACVDSSDNIYLFWNESYSGNPKRYFITKWNSSLTQQWNVEITDDFLVPTATYAFPSHMTFSPDNAYIYITTGKLSQPDCNGVTIDPSDGSLVQAWTITSTGTSGQEEYRCPVAIACNSKSVFIAGGWEDSAGVENGVGIASIPQYYFDNRTYVTIGHFQKTVHEGTDPTISSATLTSASGATTKSTWSITQADASGNLVLLDPDDPFLRDYTRKAFYLNL